MTFMNEGMWDRVIRILAGVALGYAAWTTRPESIWSATGSLVFVVLGIVALVTGIVGWCPMYMVFGIFRRDGLRGIKGSWAGKVDPDHGPVVR